MYKNVSGVLLLVLICVALYTCSTPPQTSPQPQSETIVVPTSSNPGKIQTEFYSGTISILYQQGDAEPVAVRIFDQSGKLVYGEREPLISSQEKNFIEFGHMPAGNYQVLVLLDDGRFLGRLGEVGLRCGDRDAG